MNKKINFRKYWWLILVFILSSLSLIASLALLRQPQEIRKKASVPGGQATLSISPQSGTYQVGGTIPVNIFFNTHGVTISAVALRITYPYSGNSPKVVPANISINQALLSTGDWSCPIKTISPEGGQVKIDIACVNTNPAGYSNNNDTLLASFNLEIQDIPTPNPVVLSFDPNLSVISQKDNAQDTLLTPASRGTYTITSQPNFTPTPTHEPAPISTSTPTPISTQTQTPTPTPTAAPGPTSTPTPSPQPSSGDLNGDGKINNLDLEILLNNWLTTNADLTNDSNTNEKDLTLLLANWSP